MEPERDAVRAPLGLLVPRLHLQEVQALRSAGTLPVGAAGEAAAAAGEHCDGTQEAAMIRAALKAGLHSWLMCGGIEAIRDTLFRQRGGVGRLLSAEAMLSGIQDRFFPISTSRFLGACIHGDHLSTCAAHIKTLITWATGHGRTIIS